MTDNSNSKNVLVAIGASAGGLRALQALVASLSIEAGISYIIAQHLLPNYASSMASILAKHTQLDAMPNAAIAATEIDHVLTPDEVYSVLVEWLKNT